MNDHLMKKKDIYLGPQMFDESTEDDYPNKTTTSKISSIPSSYSSDSLSSLYNKSSYSKYPQKTSFGLDDDRRKLSMGGFENRKDHLHTQYLNNKHNGNEQSNPQGFIPRSKSTNFSLSRQGYLYNDNSNMFRYPQREMEYQEDYGIFQRHPKMMHSNTQFFLEKSLQNIDYNDVDSNYQHSLEASILGSLIEPRLIDDVALLYKTYSRSLFVANVASTLSVQEITNLFEKYGELKGIIFEFRKMAHFIIVKYYDLRSARDAYHQLNGCSIHSQKLVIRNCVPIEPETEQTNCFVIIRNIKRENCSTMNLMKHFKHFGDIKDITDVVFNPNFQNNQNFVVHKIIEFYDSRAVDNLFHSYSSYLVQQQPQPQSNNSQNNTNLSSTSPFSEIFAIFSPKNTPISFERPNYSIIDKLLSPFVISCKKLISYANHQQMQEKKMSYKHNYAPMHMRGGYPLEEEEGSEELPSEEEHYNMKKGNNTVSISSSPSSPLLPFYSSNIKGKKDKGKPQSSTTSTKFVQPQEEKQTPRRKTETVSDPSLYELHLNAVRNGDDKRTTLMIKNIPNKYDQEMLLKAINKTHKHHFDFFYLPIDLKHDCNVGYAFINFIHFKSIPSFVERFNKTKWKKFNSEKICDIAYARLQGKQELINHFQNSTRIKYDKKCRPVVFASEGPNKGKEEDFPFNFEDEDNGPVSNGSNNNNTTSNSNNTNNPSGNNSSTSTNPKKKK